ncbi:MAG: alpha/beta hydrolase [Limisphaerales bacterium]
MKLLSLSLTVLATAVSLSAQPKDAFPLWPKETPGALGSDPVKDIPTLTPFFPAADKATGASVVICPGGGYGGLASHEGRDYALWLNAHGIAGFVLKYRLGSAGYRHPVMMGDVNRAVRYVRAHAADWKLDAKRIGVMGSSAGGHLASTAVTHYDSGKPDAADPIERASSRPDLGILCYPVISMGVNTHNGSKNNLLGKEPSTELVKLLSNELQVTKGTPPCFVWHTWEDKGVKIENAMEFAAALQRNGVPFDLHVYQKGPHGIGLGVKGWDPEKTSLAALHPWTHDLAVWLKVQGFTK